MADTVVNDRAELLWAAYVNDRSKERRDELIVHYMQLARYVATKLATSLSRDVEVDDLISYGTIGLIDAIERFDPARGYKFETYAMARIKGAIVDELRNLDWVPRSVRDKAKQVTKAEQALEARLHRAPTQAEVAAELDVTVADLQDMLRQVARGGLTSTSMLDEEGVEDHYGGYASGVEVDEIRRSLLEAVDGILNERETIVFVLYYKHGMTLAEVGIVLGVTESRVVQIHTEAVARVCERLAG